MIGIIDSGQKIIANGLVLNLDAAQLRSYPGSGTNWTDLSGNNNNGTLTNGPTYSSSNGGLIIVDGSNDYIPLGTNGFPLGTSDGTMCAWATTNSVTATWKNLFTYGRYDNSLYNARLLVANGSTIYFDGYADGIGWNGLTTNTWFNIVGVFENRYASLYVNGVLRAGPTQKLNWNTILGTNPAQLGRSVNGAEYWNGSIGSAYIYNRALTATEVLQNYDAVKSRFGL